MSTVPQVEEKREHGVLAVVPDGYYTRSQAADLIRRDRDTLRRWHNSGRYRATKFMRNGQLEVWLTTRTTSCNFPRSRRTCAWDDHRRGRRSGEVAVIPDRDLVVVLTTDFDDRDDAAVAGAPAALTAVTMVTTAIAPHFEGS